MIHTQLVVKEHLAPQERLQDSLSSKYSRTCGLRKWLEMSHWRLWLVVHLAVGSLIFTMRSNVTRDSCRLVLFRTQGNGSDGKRDQVHSTFTRVLITSNSRHTQPFRRSYVHRRCLWARSHLALLLSPSSNSSGYF